MQRAIRLGLALTLGAARLGTAQLATAGTGGVAALLHDLTALGANKRVLVIGAHPDDEDTDLLALLARGMGVRTAYLSLSRGEGGQNLIGPELGPELGVIRTEELLAARQLDGAEQYFTRAYDFGFSKTAAETFRFWPRDSLLADVVSIIRRFHPQIIVSIFSGTPADGHGQHQVAGLVARQAFDLLADSSWGPKKLYRSTRFDTAQTQVLLEAGRLDPTTGQSYHQIAMASRSRHRSQEMGQLERPGPAPVRLALVQAREAGNGKREAALFSGIDTILPRRAKYVALVDSARAAFNPAHPGRMVPLLARAIAALRTGSGTAVDSEQLTIAEHALATAAGIAVDGIADDWIVAPGQQLAIDAIAWNAGDAAVRLDSVTVAAPQGWAVRQTDAMRGLMAPGALLTARFTVTIPATAARTEPYFLQRPLRGALYDWSATSPSIRGLPFEPPPLTASFHLTVSGVPILVAREISQRYRDETLGEVRRPVIVDCGFDVSLAPERIVWPRGAASEGGRRFTVTVANRKHGAATTRLAFTTPAGWTPLPQQPLDFDREDETKSIALTLAQPSSLEAPAGEGDLSLAVTAVDSSGRSCSGGLSIIDYPHIRPRAIGHGSDALIRVAPLALPTLRRVGYVRGAADRVPEALAGAGVPIALLDAEALAHDELSRYDAIVIGSRAYETEPALVANNSRILDYARSGGLVIVQYQQYAFVQGRFAPYPLDIARPHDRVTDENAVVTPLDTTAPVLHTPNQLTPRDWQGWVQERGLYFAHQWGPEYTPMLEMHDPGDPPLRGGLLVAHVGKGMYVYTGLAFFRQLPAAVPGAFRLFANLLALKESS